MMKITLEKAIEILPQILSETDKILFPEKDAALKLGIEALENINDMRHLLPGETK